MLSLTNWAFAGCPPATIAMPIAAAASHAQRHLRLRFGPRTGSPFARRRRSSSRAVAPRDPLGAECGDDRRVESLRGRLLIAGPSLFDPNFRRTIVLVGEHNEEGALGVVLNHPTNVTVEEAAPPLAPIALPDGRMFIGGPVQPQGAVILAEL